MKPTGPELRVSRKRTIAEPGDFEPLIPADLELHDALFEAKSEADVLTAALAELTERLLCGRLTHDERTEIGVDLSKTATRLSGLALAVLA